MPTYHVLEQQQGRLRARAWRRGALRTTGLLLLTLLLCAVGLLLLDSTHDTLPHKAFRALWNAANLISTLGDFSDFNEHQQTFMVVVMFSVLVIAGYAVSSLTGLMSGEALMISRENRMVKKMLKDTSQHVVVMGFGPLGRLVAERVHRAGDTVVVIEREDDLAARASSLGYIVVLGDAGADDDVLTHAAIDRAKALVITIDDPDRKLAVTLQAHALNPRLKIAVTGQSSQRGSLLQRAGASEVVVADDLIARELVGRLALGQGA